MESNPYIHLSNFHVFLMLRDKPDVAEDYYGLHEQREAIRAEVEEEKRKAELRLSEFDDQISEFLRANKLRSKKKPADCDPAYYRGLIEAIRAGTYRQPDYIDVKAIRRAEKAIRKVEKLVPGVLPEPDATVIRASLMDLIERNRGAAQ